MEVYATEEQQFEAIKKWFKQYGNLLSWIILLIALAFSGITYWNHHQQVVKDTASDHYLTLLEGLEKNDKATIKSNADLLQKQYASSPYATLASFVLSYEAIKEKDLVSAEKNLNWILTHGKGSDFKDIATVRLMRLLISQNKLEEAIKLYSSKQGPYLSLMAELKGDILVSQKKLPDAKNAYELALSSAPEEGMHGPLLKMKMQELGIELTANEEKAKEATKS